MQAYIVQNGGWYVVMLWDGNGPDRRVAQYAMHSEAQAARAVANKTLQAAGLYKKMED